MSNQRRPVIAGNWKMYKTVGEARKFARELREKIGNPTPEVILCPPFTALSTVIAEVAGSPILVGAQNMNSHPQGAFTGEVSPGMLTELGVSHVVIGHSERRALFGETDETVNLKIEAALQAGLVPIICVGETLEEREATLTDTVVIVQVQRALHNVPAGKVPSLIFAYEPVWAIGTGKTCQADEANRVCGLIRETVARLYSPTAAASVRVLYGGSVKPETIAGQMAQSDVDGALVGGASLEVDSFAAIVNYQMAAR